LEGGGAPRRPLSLGPSPVPTGRGADPRGRGGGARGEALGVGLRTMRTAFVLRIWCEGLDSCPETCSMTLRPSSTLRAASADHARSSSFSASLQPSRCSCCSLRITASGTFEAKGLWQWNSSGSEAAPPSSMSWSRLRERRGATSWNSESPPAKLPPPAATFGSSASCAERRGGKRPRAAPFQQSVFPAGNSNTKQKGKPPGLSTWLMCCLEKTTGVQNFHSLLLCVSVCGEGGGHCSAEENIEPTPSDPRPAAAARDSPTPSQFRSLSILLPKRAI